MKTMSTYHKQIGLLPNLFLNGTHISFVEIIKNLGFFINGKFNCITHVNHVISRIYGVLWKLWLSASFLSVSLKLKLVRTLIVIFLTYMANIYGEFDSVSSRKLQIAITRACLTIYLNSAIKFLAAAARHTSLLEICLYCTPSSIQKSRHISIISFRS